MSQFSKKCVKKIKSALHFPRPMVNNNSINNIIMRAKSLDLYISTICVARFQGHYMVHFSSNQLVVYSHIHLLQIQFLLLLFFSRILISFLILKNLRNTYISKLRKYHNKFTQGKIFYPWRNLKVYPQQGHIFSLKWQLQWR